jgi:hypothetical protein
MVNTISHPFLTAKFFLLLFILVAKGYHAYQRTCFYIVLWGFLVLFFNHQTGFLTQILFLSLSFILVSIQLLWSSSCVILSFPVCQWVCCCTTSINQASLSTYLSINLTNLTIVPCYPILRKLKSVGSSKKWSTQAFSFILASKSDFRDQFNLLLLTWLHHPSMKTITFLLQKIMN